MASETQRSAGQCATHGTVEATRQIPRITFPAIISAVSRTMAKRRRPFVCPTCGEPVTSQ